MRSPFHSDFRVTQPFGVNPDYYKKFGLHAHEGIDLVPTSSDWTLLSLTDGVVVRDEDNPRSGAYGVYLTILDQKNNRAFQYCHLEKNVLGVGDIVRKGDNIGRMGATGNVTGAHLHLNMFETDEDGIRLNGDNGYLGGIDPLPFLQGGDDDMEDTIPVKKEDFERLVAKSSAFDEVKKALELPDDAGQETVLKSIAGTKGLVNSLQRDKAILESEKQNKDDQLANERILCQSDKGLLEQSVKRERKAKEDVISTYNTLKGKWDDTRKELGTTKNKLAECKSGRTPMGFWDKIIWLINNR